MPLDPYRQWLQICGEQRPPDHYVLLGLQPFESDGQRIVEAFHKRFAIVRKYEVGTHEERAVELLEELSQAFQCLSNPHSKRRYDQQLRKQRSERALSSAQKKGAVQGPGGLLESRPDARPDARAAAVGSRAARELVVGELVGTAQQPAVDKASLPTDRLPRSPRASGWLAVGLVLAAAWLLSRLIQPNPGFGSAELTGGNEPDVPQLGFEQPDQQQDPRPGDMLPLAGKAEAESDPPSGQWAAGSPVHWTGTLSKVLSLAAPRGSASDGPAPAVHLLVSPSAAGDSPAFEAAAPDVLFLREIADYVSRSENPASADVVTVQGTLRGPQFTAARLDASLPLVELHSISKADNTSPAVVGGRREASELGWQDDELDLACKLRQPGSRVQFEGTVRDKRYGDDLQLQVEVLGRYELVAMSHTGLDTFSALRPGDCVLITARPTDRFVWYAGSPEAQCRLLEGLELRPAGASLAAPPGQQPGALRAMSPQVAARQLEQYRQIRSFPAAYTGRSLRWSATYQDHVLAESPDGLGLRLTVQIPAPLDGPPGPLTPGSSALRHLPTSFQDVVLKGYPNPATRRFLGRLSQGDPLDMGLHVGATPSLDALLVLHWVSHHGQPQSKVEFDPPPSASSRPTGPTAPPKPTPAQQLALLHRLLRQGNWAQFHTISKNINVRELNEDERLQWGNINRKRTQKADQLLKAGARLKGSGSEFKQKMQRVIKIDPNGPYGNRARLLLHSK